MDQPDQVVVPSAGTDLAVPCVVPDETQLNENEGEAHGHAQVPPAVADEDGAGDDEGQRPERGRDLDGVVPAAASEQAMIANPAGELGKVLAIRRRSRTSLGPGVHVLSLGSSATRRTCRKGNPYGSTSASMVWTPTTAASAGRWLSPSAERAAIRTMSADRAGPKVTRPPYPRPPLLSAAGPGSSRATAARRHLRIRFHSPDAVPC